MNFRLVWMGPDDNVSAGPTVRGGHAHHGFSDRYEKRGTEMFRKRFAKSGRSQLIPLANFSARIACDFLLDDDLEQVREFGIEAELANRKVTFSLSASEFMRMGWVLRYLGPGAIIYPGQQQHTRAAIQWLSGQVRQERIFTHLGWAKQDGNWAYLHGAGAVGAEGFRGDVLVRLPAALARYHLESPGGANESVTAVRSSLRLLSVTRDRISFPLFAGSYLSVLGDADFSLFLYGETGTFKSSLAALCQQHFGREMDASHLPGNFASTASALEEIAFAAKDALLVVDDFVPTGGPADGTLHNVAERLFRAAGNRQGRSRMGGTAALRPPRPPRGLLLATGEDLPSGQSLRARLLVIELRDGEVDRAVLEECQNAGRQGLLATAMAAFLSWLAGRFQQVRQDHLDRVRDLRREYRGTVHSRLPGAVSNLQSAFEVWLQFALESGAISDPEHIDLKQRNKRALGEVLALQLPYHQASDPALRFLSLLRAAVATGRAHVANRLGGTPEAPAAWGWRAKPSGRGWAPQGARIGWVAGGDLFLDPEVGYQAAQQMAGAGRLPVGEQALRHRLQQRGLLASTDAGRKMLQVRRTLEGRPRQVLHFKSSAIMG